MDVEGVATYETIVPYCSAGGLNKGRTLFENVVEGQETFGPVGMQICSRVNLKRSDTDSGRATRERKLVGIQLVVLGRPVVDGLHGKGVAQHEGDATARREVNRDTLSPLPILSLRSCW